MSRLIRIFTVCLVNLFFISIFKIGNKQGCCPNLADRPNLPDFTLEATSPYTVDLTLITNDHKFKQDKSEATFLDTSYEVIQRLRSLIWLDLFRGWGIYCQYSQTCLKRPLKNRQKVSLR